MKMKVVTLAMASVVRTMENSVIVEVDADTYRGIRKRFRVSTLPTLVLLTPAFEEIDRITGFVPADRFKREYRRIISGENSFRSLKETVESGEADGGIHFSLAQEYGERGMISEAEEHFLMARENGSPEDEVLFGLALCKRDRGEFSMAALLMEEALRIGGEHNAKLYQLAVCYYRAGNLPDCIRTCNRIMKADEAENELQAFSLFLKGLCFRKLGVQDRADEIWSQLLEKFPKSRYRQRVEDIKNNGSAENL